MASSPNSRTPVVQSSQKNSKVCKHEDETDIVLEVFTRFIRGFSSGLCLRTGYTFITSLLKNSLKASFVKTWRTLWSKHCVRTALFLGLFPSVYQLSLKILKETRKTEDDLNYGIAGALAGLTIVFLGKDSKQTITFFSLSRAIGSSLSMLVTRGDLPYIPFMEVPVFAACCSLILYSACLRPDYLTPGYYHSILKWAQDYSDPIAATVFRYPRQSYVSCQEAGVHQNPSCVKHNFMNVRLSFPAFAKIYFPIHALPVLLYKRQLLKKSPVSVFQSFMKNMFYSTSFLVTMVTVAKLLLCLLRDYIHRPPPVPSFIPLLSAFVGSGLGVLWERESRRKELTLFVVFQTMGIIYTAFKKSSLPFSEGGIPCGFPILFSLSMMTVMHAYEKQPTTLNSVINAALTFLVGKRDSQKKTLKVKGK